MRRLGGRVLDGIAITIGWWLATLAVAGVLAAARKAQTAAAARAKVVHAVQRAAASPGMAAAMAEHPTFRPHLRMAPPNGDHRP